MKSIAVPRALSLNDGLWSRADAWRAARRVAARLRPVREPALVSAFTALGAAAIASGAALESKSADAAPYNPSAAVPLAEPPPLLLRDLDPQDALSINRGIPFSAGPHPAAAPFKAAAAQPAVARAIDCLTATIYYEAANETPDGQRGVAQVVLNRVRHPAFPQSVCGVVFQGSTRTTGCQFSFTCDGSMRRRPSTAGWARARAVAEQALGGAVFSPVGNATHYHANYVVPYWATSLAKNGVVGTHIFYRWPGWWGQPAAFSRRHSGEEADPRLLRNAALRRFGVSPIMGTTAEDLAFAIDPRVELINIVQLLAAEPDPDAKPTPYEAAVREHFAGHSEHVAVLIYRQLGEADAAFDAGALLQIAMHYSELPKLESRTPVDSAVAKAIGGRAKLAGFIAALRDFAEHSDFMAFVGAQQPFYAELEAQAREPTFVALVEQERETGASAQPLRFILAPLLDKAAAAACEPARKGPRGALVLMAAGDIVQPLKKALVAASKAGCANKVGAKSITAFLPPLRRG